MLFRYLLTMEEPSLLEEIRDYLVDKYFTIDYGYYSNIDVDSNPFISLPTLIFSLFIGVLIASVLAIFNKGVLGDFVRAIAREDATSPEKAKTLAELGFLKNSAVRSALKKKGALRHTVRCVEDDRADLAAGIPLRAEIAALYGCGCGETAPTAEKGAKGSTRTNLNEARFFIPKDKLITAELRYEKKGTNWLVFFGILILSIAVVIVLFRVMPDILQLIDNFISMVND